jgi:hypothetical protein
LRESEDSNMEIHTMQTLVQIQNTIDRMQKHDLKPKIKSIIQKLGGHNFKTKRLSLGKNNAISPRSIIEKASKDLKLLNY